MWICVLVPVHRPRRHARFGAALGQVQVKWKVRRGAQGGKWFVWACAAGDGGRAVIGGGARKRFGSAFLLRSSGRAAAHDLEQLLGKCRSGAKRGAARTAANGAFCACAGTIEGRLVRAGDIANLERERALLGQRGPRKMRHLPCGCVLGACRMCDGRKLAHGIEGRSGIRARCHLGAAAMRCAMRHADLACGTMQRKKRV